MSVKKGVFTVLLFSGVSLWVYLYQSSPTKPKQTRKSFLQSEYTARGVIDRTIQLKINYQKAKINSERVEISAEISLPFDYSDKLNFKWKLGENVSLIEGEQTGAINGIRKDEKRKIKILVTGFSKENNHHIGFEVYGIRNGKTIFADSLIASDLENTFENTVQQVEKIKASE